MDVLYKREVLVELSLSAVPLVIFLALLNERNLHGTILFQAVWL